MAVSSVLRTVGEMMRRRVPALLLAAALAMTTACSSRAPEADPVARPVQPVAYALVNTINGLNASLRLSPLESSRILAYSMLAAWIAYQDSEPLERDRTAIVAGSEVAARLLQEPTRAIEARNLVRVYGVERDADAWTHGSKIAEAVLREASSVGYATSEMPWTPGESAAGLPWAPTGRGEPGLEPGWGQLQPIVEASATCTLPAPNRQKVIAQARELLENFDRRTALGEDVMWWLSGTGTPTPAGQWLRIVVNSAQEQNLDPAVALEMLTKAAVAANDAAIIGWREKYRHNLARPESVWSTFDRVTVLPVLPRETPSHPSYPSGHSFFGAAVVKSVLPYLGDVTAFDQLPADLYVPAERRSWPSLSAALSEAGRSRVNAGFHFPMDVSAGQQLGTCVADAVSARLEVITSDLRDEVGR